LVVDLVNQLHFSESSKILTIFHEIQETFPRMKHIDQKYHFVREHTTEENVILQKVKTTDNLADIFTKPLKKESSTIWYSVLGFL